LKEAKRPQKERKDRMNWTLADSIATMPGPLFLVLYGSIIALTLALCRWALHRPDWTAGLPPLSIPSEPDPYEIAYLRGGVNELSRLLIFSLLERGYLSIVDPKKQLIQRAQNRSELALLIPIERAMLDSFSEARPTHEVFTGGSERIELYCTSYREHLEAQELIVWCDAQEGRAWEMRLVGASVILALGAYKLLAASATGHTNVGFLIGMAAISLLILVQVTKPPRLSSRGQVYLERLQTAYGTARQERARMNTSGAEPASMLLVGLFGLEALGGAAHDVYSELFPKASSSSNAGTAGCGADCGSGCGGCGD
jgi:uncharacterized protein (TIGR04222 family)